MRVKSFHQFFESLSSQTKLAELKQHLDRSNIDLANWIVELGYPHEGQVSEDDAVRIIKAVDNKEWWPKLPSMYFFDSPAEDVADGTWLIHFTRHPEAISNEGFKHGEPDHLKLGMNWGHRSKGEPGFNYAFEPKDLIEKYGSLEKAFFDWVSGGGAILFKAPAIKVWHFGDSIEQVIFWGPDAREITPIFREKGSWSATDRSFSTLDEAADLILTR